MSVLLHLSDTHFGTEQPAVVEALRHLARTQRPERAILSGDVTQRARRGQFAAARRFVDSLPMPTLAIPGNHDIPLFNLAGRLLRPYAGFRRAFGQALECEWSAPGWLVIGINTTRWWRHKHGEVSRAQVARVAERLRRPDDQRNGLERRNGRGGGSLRGHGGRGNRHARITPYRYDRRHVSACFVEKRRHHP